MAVSFVALAALYLGVYYTVHEYFSLTQIPVTPWSIALCVLLADLAYCFEHRFSHRVGIAWATHTVHHSSPYFNWTLLPKKKIGNAPRPVPRWNLALGRWRWCLPNLAFNFLRFT